MKVSINWVKELLPKLKAGSAQIAERLTAAGIEVESVEEQASRFAEVVSAEVRTVDPHPNADKLRVTTVFDGESVRQVVCGAPNVVAGQKVALAKVGAVLPNGLAIAAREVRGVRSEGMICSEAELGVSEEADGIMVLPARTQPGKPIAPLIGMTDAVLEIAPGANRPDMLSHLGVARELAALWRIDPPQVAPKVKESGEDAESVAKVEIRAGQRCPRYVARVLQGVKVGPSPSWVVRRLEAMGLRPISNVVDATNLVLLELGHPLHAFDLEKLNGHRIVVRTAKEDEKIATIDGVERKLTEDDLVIADAAVPVAIAGVMGGAETGVSEGTTQILLESAMFDPRSVRRTSKRQGLKTDASYRFERGADPLALDVAVDRCAQLIVELAGGRVLPGRIEAVHEEHVPPIVPIRADRATELLGRPVDKAEIRAILGALGLKKVPAPKPPKAAKKGKKGAVARKKGPPPDAMFFRVPSWRVDLNREEELIEEVARVSGYDSIPAVMPPFTQAVWTEGPKVDEQGRVRELLAAEGLHEHVSLAFSARNQVLALGHDLGRAVWLANPLGEESAVMRMSMLPALLRAARLNQSLGKLDLRLFEVGKTFEWGRPAGELPVETHRAGIVLRGRRFPRTWGAANDALDAFDLKAVIEALLAAYRVRGARFEADQRKWLHPRSGTKIMLGERELGAFGEVHPDAMAAFELEGAPVFAAELDLDALFASKGPRPMFRPLPKLQSAWRDLSFFIDRNVPAADILGTVRASAPEGHLETAEIFDVFDKEDRRSIALRMTFRAEDRTLTDVEVDAFQELVVRALEGKLGAHVRRA